MKMSNEILQRYTTACRGKETESLQLHIGMPPKQQGHISVCAICTHFSKRQFEPRASPGHIQHQRGLVMRPRKSQGGSIGQRVNARGLAGMSRGLGRPQSHRDGLTHPPRLAEHSSSAHLHARRVTVVSRNMGGTKDTTGTSRWGEGGGRRRVAVGRGLPIIWFVLFQC